MRESFESGSAFILTSSGEVTRVGTSGSPLKPGWVLLKVMAAGVLGPFLRNTVGVWLNLASIRMSVSGTKSAVRLSSAQVLAGAKVLRSSLTPPLITTGPSNWALRATRDYRSNRAMPELIFLSWNALADTRDDRGQCGLRAQAAHHGRPGRDISRAGERPGQ